MDKFKGQHEMGDCHITMVRKLREVCNDKCHNFYYEARFRIYTDKTHYYKGNFVIWFDVFDLQDEYPNKKRISKKDIRDYAETLAYNFMDGAPRKNVNGETLKPFYAECRKTIMDYNGHSRFAA